MNCILLVLFLQLMLLEDVSGSLWVKKSLIKRQTKIKKGKLVTRLKKVDKEFKVEFEFLPGAPSYWWKNVIRFSIGTTDKKYGDRIPAIFYHGVSYSKLEISSAVNGNGIFTTSVFAPPYTWYKVVITQEKEKGGRDYIYSVHVNDKEAVNIVNEKVVRFHNVSVWVSDPFYSPQTGFVRNLNFYEKGVFKCKKGKWKCKTIDVCIDFEKRCDYVVHCADDSDEQECPTTPAPTTTTTPAPTTPPAYLQFSIYCTELTVMGVWERWIFKTKGPIEIHLNDPNCNKMGGNGTHIWISTNFTECNSIAHEHGDTLYQQNTAVVTLSDAKDNIRRTTSYKYNMRCLFDRSVNVSTSDGFETIGQVAAVMNGSAMANFRASIDIFNSPSFLELAKHPIKVTSYEPMYIGIREVNQNKNLKFIVNQCFATPTSRIHDVNYMFFALKCPLDPSFKMVNQSSDHFYFSINAFTFIEITKSVHIHCTLYICRTNSTSPACQQGCKHDGNRQRRNIPGELIDKDNKPLQQGILTTPEIVFEKKSYCHEVYCPDHSTCIDLYPAACRCEEHYVQLRNEGTCTRERVFNVQNLHVRGDFLSVARLDTSSAEWLRWAVEMENQLYNVLYLVEEGAVEGLKVIGAKSDGTSGLFLDLALVHASLYTREETFDSFLHSVNTYGSKSCVVTRRIVLVCSNVAPSLMSDIDANNDIVMIVRTDDVVLLSIILPLTVIILLKLFTVMVQRYESENDAAIMRTKTSSKTAEKENTRTLTINHTADQ